MHPVLEAVLIFAGYGCIEALLALGAYGFLSMICWIFERGEK